MPFYIGHWSDRFATDYVSETVMVESPESASLPPRAITMGPRSGISSHEGHTVGTCRCGWLFQDKQLMFKNLAADWKSPRMARFVFH